MSKLDVVSIRLVKDAPIMSDKPIGNPIAAVELLGKQLCDMDREVLCVINLKANGVPINCNFVSMGAVDQTVAHPRELFKSAILSNASSLLLLHNHPSGNLNPSKEDCMLTDRMLKLSELIGIPLVDHVIVGGNNESYFSFKEKDMLDFEHNKLIVDYRNIEFPQLAVADDAPIAEEKIIPIRHRRR